MMRWLPAAERHPLLLAAALALTVPGLFLHLGLPPLSGIHEARVLETGREMLERGDWVVPHFVGEPRLEKPPLPYWTAALSFLLAGGPSPGAARLVVGGLGLLMLLAAWSIARAVADRRTALLVLPVLAGGLLFNTEFRKVTTDPYLAALTSAAVAAFAWAFRRPGRSGTAALALAYLFLALALLAKGPIALAFTAFGAWGVRPMPGQTAVRHGWRRHVLGLLLACLPLAAWALAVAHRLPDAYEIWRHEVWGRVTGEVEEERGRGFYFPALLVAVAPLLLPFLAATARGLLRREPLALWLAGGLVFLLLLSSRKTAYLLPLMTPAALLSAHYLARLAEFREGHGLALLQAGMNVLLAAAILGAAVAWRDHLVWSAVLVGLPLAAASLLLVRALAQRQVPVPLLILSALLLTTFYGAVLKPHLPADRGLVNLAAYIKAHVPRRTALYHQGALDPRLAFYIDRLPERIAEQQLHTVAGPAWLLRRDPLRPELTTDWEPVLQTAARPERRLYLYRRRGTPAADGATDAPEG